MASWEMTPTKSESLRDNSGIKSIDEEELKCFDVPERSVIRTFLGKGDRKNNYLITDEQFSVPKNNNLKFGTSSLSWLNQEYWGNVKEIEGIFNGEGEKKFLKYPVSKFREFVRMNMKDLNECNSDDKCPLAQVPDVVFKQFGSKMYR